MTAYNYLGLTTYSTGKAPVGYFPIALEEKENPSKIIAAEWRELKNGRPKDERYTPALSTPHGKIIYRNDTGEK